MRSFAQEWSAKQLIDRCSRRPAEEIAWQEFVRRFHPTIRASVSSVLARLIESDNGPKAGSIEDVVDELIEGVYSRLIEKDGACLKRARRGAADSMKSYLLLVSINVVRDYLGEGVPRQGARARFASPRFGPAFGLAPTSLRQ